MKGGEDMDEMSSAQLNQYLENIAKLIEPYPDRLYYIKTAQSMQEGAPVGAFFYLSKCISKKSRSNASCYFCYELPTILEVGGIRVALGTTSRAPACGAGEARGFFP